MSDKNSTTPLTPEEIAERKKERKNIRNARIARGRFFKNLFIWFLGVLFIPTAIIVATFAIPVGLLTGNRTDVVSEDLSNKSLFSVALTVATNFQAFGLSDFPIVVNTLSDAISDSGLDKYVTVDNEKLLNVKFSSDVGKQIVDCVDIVATLDTLGAVDKLGEFSKLSIINEDTFAGTVGELTTGSGADRKLVEGKNAKEYYYKVEEGETVKYYRAFDDEGNIVTELSLVLSDYQLYFPPLKLVKILDLTSILPDSFGRVTVSSLLDAFDAKSDMLIKIIGENTKISELKTFDIDSVKLSDVIKIEGNEKLYDVIVGATTATSAEEVTLGHLSNFEVNDILLTSVIAYDASTQKLYDMLVSATAATSAEELTIGHLSGVNIDNVKLTSILANEGNAEKLYDMLVSALGVESVDDITISEFTSFDVNNVELETVFPKTGNEKLWNILEEAIEHDADKPITINDLSHFNVDNVSVDTVIVSAGGNKVLNAILGKDVKLGELGTAINNMDISEIFDTACFVTDSEKAIDTENKYSYNVILHRYTLDNVNGTYYISKNAKTWLFTLFEYSDVDTDTGVARTYTAKSSTFGDISDTFGGDVSSRVMNATVKQLIQSGIIDETGKNYSKLYKYTVKGAFDLLAEKLALVP